MAPQPPGDSGAPSPAAVRVLPRPAQQQAGSYDRVPPHNLDAEVSVLGGMLLSKDAIAEVAELIGPEDFYRGAHRTMFEVARELYDHGEPVDAVTLADALERRGQLDDVGGAVGVTDLVAKVPTAANALYYARIVADHAMRRRLIDVGTQITKLGYEPPVGVADAVDTAESLIFAVAQRGRYAGEFVPMKRLMGEAMDLLEQLQDNNSAVTGLETGFLDLDALTAGLQPGNLIIVAARPSMGKTTLVMNVASHVAVELRKPVVMFSLEMSTAELVQRLLSAEARIDTKRLKTGALEDRDWIKLSQATGKLAEAPLFLDDNSAINLMEIRSKCRRLKQEHGLDLVIVDYLQLMQSHRRVENRVQEVSELSRGLKILAKELSVPVIALSQLSRKPEDRTDRRPQLADLRESGCLTADTRVLRADTGAEESLGDLLARGERDIPVWTVDRHYRLVRGTMTHVFASGTKPVFKLRLASGRQVEASANHPFLTYDGWRRLDELRPGVRLAVPRRSPPPLTTVEWPDEKVVLLAHLLGNRSGDESVPSPVFGLSDRQVALFLRHLWATGGHLGRTGRTVTMSYESESRRLVDDVQTLLLRFGIQSRLRTVSEQGYDEAYQLWVSDVPSQRLFLERIGVHGARGEQAGALLAHLNGVVANPNVDTAPVAVWDQVRRRQAERGLSQRAFAAALSVPYSGTHLYRHAPSRERLQRVAAVLQDEGLSELATSDLYWDSVVAVEPLGEQPVFDATVLGTHNFIANGIVVENSIEQDADIVAFIYRDEVYNEESAAKGEAELIVAKHRNGPLKTVRLSFLGHHSRFANMARGLPPPGGI
jgi:replicative DNA helicase